MSAHYARSLKHMSDLWIEDFKRKVRTGQVVYWMQERTGRMREIILKFLRDGTDLTEEELEILKWYIEQFVDAMPMRPPKWRERLAACTTKKQLREYNWMLVSDYAIDPF